MEDSDIYDLVIPPWRERSFVGRILARFFPNGSRPPTGVIVYEYSKGDWDGGHCLGDPVQAWRVTPTGPVNIDPETSIEQTSVGPWYSEYAIYRFCLSPDRRKIMCQRIEGPRAGSRTIYDIENRNGRLALTNRMTMARS